MRGCAQGCTCILEYDKPGPDVVELRGDVGRVEHDHGLTDNIGCEVRNGSILLFDGHNLEAGWKEEGFDRLSTV